MRCNNMGRNGNKTKPSLGTYLHATLIDTMVWIALYTVFISYL